MDEYLAEIRGFGGNFAPRNWAFCQGQLMAISSNQALFSLLGTTYGGDGRTTFALPDLRGRTPLSAGTGPGLSTRKLGQRGGTQTETLTINQIPSHTHIANFTLTGGIAEWPATTGTATSEEPAANAHLGATDAGGNGYIYAAGNTADTNMQNMPVNVTGDVTIGPTGGTQAHANLQPFLVINWIICIQGLFPTRS